MGKLKKVKKKNETLISILILVLGFWLIILFIFVVGNKVNEEPTEPNPNIYTPINDDYLENDADSNVKDEDENSDETEENPEEVEDPVPVNPNPPINTTPTTQTTTSNWWSYPATIVEIPIGQINLTTVVDKGHKLPSTYVPANLVTVTQLTGIRLVFSGTQLTQQTVNALNLLGAQAKADGINLSIRTAYRSYSTQASTYNYWVSYNGGNIDAADKVSARPGHSEHQLGTVADFSCSEIGDVLGSAFDSTNAYKWLVANAAKYGFRQSYKAGQESETGYSAESWHWRYMGQ